jgi:hypothetical protein
MWSSLKMEKTGQQKVVNLDLDVQTVAEFMQEHVPAAKLVMVAESLPLVARLLWGSYDRETCQPAVLISIKPISLDSASQLPTDAT